MLDGQITIGLSLWAFCQLWLDYSTAISCQAYITDSWLKLTSPWVNYIYRRL